MTRTGLVAILAFAAPLALAAQAPTPELSKEMKSLQGSWVITVANGQAVDNSSPEVVFTLTGDKYTQTANGQVVERGTMKLDSSKTPMAIDMFIQEGEDANKTQLGVIKIGQDTVTGKMAAAGATERPKDFEPANDGSFSFTAKKVK
jgi:uncharacterized protein (TIGR03067 family)